MAPDKAPRIYTYKITFEETRHYYYGVHKEKYYNDPYMGSPVTHKWMWNFYTPEKQILEVFDYSEEGWMQALAMESSMIRYFYHKDPYCLNEFCSGVYSLKHRIKSGRKGGIVSAKKNRENGTGVFGLTQEQRSERGKKAIEVHREKQIGFFRPDQQEIRKRNGSVVGKRHSENGTGLYGLSPEKRFESCSKGGKKNHRFISEKVWQCTVTGHVSTISGLNIYQRHRNIDLSNRIQIKPYSDLE